MRVLCLTNMYPTEREPQFGCFVKEQVEDLRARNLEIDVVSFDGRSDPSQYARAAVRLRRRLRLREYDLVHAHYGVTGAVALVQRKLPVVTTFYGSDIGFIRWQRRVSWVVARLCTPIFVSAAAARRMGRLDAAVIPTPVDLDRFSPIPRGEARELLGWRQDVPYLLFPASRTSPVKDPELFDRVAAALRQKESRLQTVSLERLARDRVALVMNAVDATLMTSRSEGSPVAVKESLACMTPVVSVDVGDVNTVLSGLPGCSVQPRDPECLAKGVLDALSAGKSPELRARMLAYSRPEMAARVEAVLRSVVTA